MRVYRATPTGNGYRVQIVVEVGRLVATPSGHLVELANGDREDTDGWHVSRSAAWDAAGDQIEHLAHHLQTQANACRERSLEEVMG
jgi:hypothetical protein